MYHNGYPQQQQQPYQSQSQYPQQQSYQSQYQQQQQPHQYQSQSQYPQQQPYQSQPRYPQQQQPQYQYQQQQHISQEEQRYANEYNRYIDPYAQLQSRSLAHNEYDTYVRPLPSQELIEDDHKRKQSSDEFYAASKPSPVESNGLRPIRTSRVDEPTVDAALIKAQREREEQDFTIPRAAPGDLAPIKVQKEKGVSARRLKKMRRNEQRDMVATGPPPDTVNCGWSEYQGGATYEDIHNYRDYELGHLKEAQRAQTESGAPVYYS